MKKSLHIKTSVCVEAVYPSSVRVSSIFSGPTYSFHSSTIHNLPVARQALRLNPATFFLRSRPLQAKILLLVDPVCEPIRLPAHLLFLWLPCSLSLRLENQFFLLLATLHRSCDNNSEEALPTGLVVAIIIGVAARVTSVLAASTHCDSGICDEVYSETELFRAL